MKTRKTHNKDFIVIGKPKYDIVETNTTSSKKLIKPLNRFRIYVQQKTKGKEAMRSIMVYDFTGRATVDTVMKKIKSI